MSKIGEHNYGSPSTWTARAPILKVFNSDPGVLRLAPDNAIRVARKYFPSQSIYPGAGVDAANQVIAMLGGYWHRNLFVELYVGPDQSAIGPLCDMIVEALPVVRQANLRLAAFSWYTGQPESNIWSYVAGRNWCGLNPYRDALSLQEYTKTGGIFDTQNVGRFKLAIAAGWTGPIIITEGGYDNSGTNAGGWRANLSEDQYYAYLQAKDIILASYPQVLGECIFSSYPTSDWSNFEFHDPRGQFSIEETPVASPTEPPSGQTNTALTDRLAALEDHDAKLTNILKLIVSGQWTGAAGAAGKIVELDGGQQDFVPVVFP